VADRGRSAVRGAPSTRRCATTRAAPASVELTPKGASRLRLIIDELTLDHERVVYVVAGCRVRGVVERAVDDLDRQPQVSIVDLACFALPAQVPVGGR
jgi:hypothetical protein